MPRPLDDDLPRGSAPGRRGSSGDRLPGARDGLNTRTLTLVGGFALAVGATVAVFVTDNRVYLRIAVLAVAWAFVLATLAVGRRSADQVSAEAREARLRHAYELELEREVTARREYELELEHDLRRESEDAMRDELDALRAEIASLARLRDEVAGVSAMRHDLADLAALRDDVARVAELRDDVAALTAFRADLGQLAELRADLSRFRAELGEQLSSEMLVERIVMRTQGGRLGPDTGRFEQSVRPLDVSSRWADDSPPRELTGGWPAIRLDDSRQTSHVEPVRADRSVPGSAPSTSAMWSSAPETSAFPSVAPTPPPAPSPDPTETPLEWLTARSLVDPAPVRPAPPPPVPPSTQVRASVAARPSPRPRPTPPPPSVRLQADLAPVRRRPDEAGSSTAERPVASANQPAPGAPGTDGRLAEILAENGVSPATGSRRRHRYRDDDEPDDVLARVLGLR
jgi:hypothetical protein